MNSNQKIDTLNFQEEINFRKFFISLMPYKYLIIGVTSLFPLIVYLYLLSIPLAPNTYKVSAYFAQPSSISVRSFNNDGFKATPDSLFSLFTSKISLATVHREVFNNSNFQKDNRFGVIEEEDISSMINTLALNINYGSNIAMDKVIPSSISIEGSNTNLLSAFLNELIKKSDLLVNSDILSYNNSYRESKIKELKNERTNLIRIEQLERLRLIKSVKQKNELEIKIISQRISELVLEANKKNLNEIAKIKSDNEVKVKIISAEIKRIKISAENAKQNLIASLDQAAKLAGYLGVIENSLEISLAGENITAAPEWYLYGEKALLKRIELLKNRENNDAFNPKLIELNDQLSEVKNDFTARKLELRLNDEAYIPGLISLRMELARLEGDVALRLLETREDDTISIVRLTPIEMELKRLANIEFASHLYNYPSFQISKGIKIEAITSTSYNRLILLITFFVSFIFSVIIAQLTIILKSNDQSSS